MRGCEGRPAARSVTQDGMASGCVCGGGGGEGKVVVGQ